MKLRDKVVAPNKELEVFLLIQDFRAIHDFQEHSLNYF